MATFTELLADASEETRTGILERLTTPDQVDTLLDGEVFVFGSNGEGYHGAGAAAAANRLFGAEWGVGNGPTGRSYAIDTMSGWDVLQEEAATLIKYAEEHSDTIFLLTPVGTGIAGYSVHAVAVLFDAAPPNVIRPAAFRRNRA